MVHSECHPTHIFMVLLKVDELFLQRLDLTLQVHAAHVCVIDELPQTNDVGLHRLADGQLRLVSKWHRAQDSEDNFTYIGPTYSN